jgi:hypothetical protein
MAKKKARNKKSAGKRPVRKTRKTGKKVKVVARLTRADVPKPPDPV